MVAERTQSTRSVSACLVHMLRLDNSGAVSSKHGAGGESDASGLSSLGGKNRILEMEGPGFKDVSIKEKAISAAGAAFLSAVLVNPLDVAKTRLQAQAAGVDYNASGAFYHVEPNVTNGGKCPPVCPRIGNTAVAPLCRPQCFQYKDTLDVFKKVIRQEGTLRLWRGTPAALAIAIPTAQKEIRCGVKPPGVVAILQGVVSTMTAASSPLQATRLLWTGAGAQLARDVPFSAICWGALEPTRRHILQVGGPDPQASTVLGANFSAGVLAGSVAALLTCPLDVAKTRRQIEQDPSKAMSTMQTLHLVWRDAGLKGLFAGVVPRVARAGPSVAMVVSFYEVVKYFLGEH